MYKQNTYPTVEELISIVLNSIDCCFEIAKILENEQATMRLKPEGLSYERWDEIKAVNSMQLRRFEECKIILEILENLNPNKKEFSIAQENLTIQFKSVQASQTQLELLIPDLYLNKIEAIQTEIDLHKGLNNLNRRYDQLIEAIDNDSSLSVSSYDSYNDIRIANNARRENLKELGKLFNRKW